MANIRLKKTLSREFKGPFYDIEQDAGAFGLLIYFSKSSAEMHGKRS